MIQRELCVLVYLGRAAARSHQPGPEVSGPAVPRGLWAAGVCVCFPGLLRNYQRGLTLHSPPAPDMGEDSDRGTQAASAGVWWGDNGLSITPEASRCPVLATRSHDVKLPPLSVKTLWAPVASCGPASTLFLSEATDRWCFTAMQTPTCFLPAPTGQTDLPG